MKFGTLLSSLAKKTGIDTTKAEFADLLSHDIEIPDEIANAIDKGLMNEEAAKTKFKTAHRTEALNGVDAKVDEVLTELGYSDEEIADIRGEKNSYEKVVKLARTIKSLESKKSGTRGEAKDALEKKIDELSKEINSTKKSLTDKEAEFANLREEDLKDFELQKILLGKEFSLPKEMDTDLKISTALSAVNKSLQAKGFKFIRDKETKALKIVDKDGNKAYSETHDEVQPLNFIDGVLAQNKLLKVNDQGQGGGGNNGHDTIILSGGEQGKSNHKAMSEVDTQLKEVLAGS